MYSILYSTAYSTLLHCWHTIICVLVKKYLFIILDPFIHWGQTSCNHLLVAPTSCTPGCEPHFVNGQQAFLAFLPPSGIDVQTFPSYQLLFCSVHWPPPCSWHTSGTSNNYIAWARSSLEVKANLSLFLHQTQEWGRKIHLQGFSLYKNSNVVKEVSKKTWLSKYIDQ